MKNGELLIDKNGLMYYEDILIEIAKKENCGTYNIKDWHRVIDPKTGYHNGIVKYVVYEESDLHQNIKEIINKCNIQEYKVDGNSAILLNDDTIRISYFEITGRYTLTVFKDYQGKEKKYAKIDTVIKNINKMLNK